MKRLIFSLVVLSGLFFSKEACFGSKVVLLSDKAEISLMTCGPGEESYTLFGHSALWLSDPVNGIDRVYNYGTFNFDDNFMYYFVRGIADYYLSITNSQNFLEEYISEDRTVRSQLLTLSQMEKQTLFEALEENYKPENRVYRYDFLFLNCSSVIRDKVFESLNQKYELDQEEYNQTYRDLLQPYLNDNWIDLGVNFILGRQADRPASNWDRMFLPDFMFDQFEKAKIMNQKSLAPESKTIFLSTRTIADTSFEGPTYLFFFLFLLIGIVTKKKLNNKKWNLGLDSILFLFSGLLGLLLCFTWFFSEHNVLHQNLNMLWAFPLHIFLVIMIWIPAFRSSIRLYGKVFFFVNILFIILALLKIQLIPTPIFLLAGMTMFRLFRFAFFPDVVYQVKS